MSGGLFSGIGEAKPSFGANYAREGHYLMFIKRIKKDRNIKKIEFVAIEMVCLKVINVEGVSDPHRVGEQCSHLLMSDKLSFLSNMKAMVANVMGVDSKEVTEEDCELIVGNTQPLSCRVVELQNREIRLQLKPHQIKAGQEVGDPFTLVNYKRTLPPDEVAATIDNEILERFLSVEEMKSLTS